MEKKFASHLDIGQMLRLAGSILICQIAGGIGSLYTAPAIPEWYVSLHKPAFTPPDEVFGSVWGVMYLLMGISLYLIVRRGMDDRIVQIALAAFALQLVCNVLWSILFFGHESPILGLIDITVLMALVAVTIDISWRVSKGAAILLVPYFLWVMFAGMLNYSIWQLNP
jgi:translocator protein